MTITSHVYHATFQSLIALHAGASTANVSGSVPESSLRRMRLLPSQKENKAGGGASLSLACLAQQCLVYVHGAVIGCAAAQSLLASSATGDTLLALYRERVPRLPPDCSAWRSHSTLLIAAANLKAQELLHSKGGQLVCDGVLMLRYTT